MGKRGGEEEGEGEGEEEGDKQGDVNTEEEERSVSLLSPGCGVFRTDRQTTAQSNERIPSMHAF